MTTTLILKGNPDHFNRKAVYIRFSDKQKRTHVKTDLLLTEEQFNRFKGGSPLKSEGDTYKKFLKLMDRPTEKKEGINFFEYVSQCLREWDKEKSSETIRQIMGEKSKIQKFNPSFTLSDITPEFLREYKEYCKKLGNSTNTQWKSFKFLRMIVLKAKKEKLIDENPFQVFPMPKYKDPEKKYLTDHDIKKLETLIDKPLPSEIYFAAVWFLIGCYSGLRFGDMQAFEKKKHLVGGRLIMYTSKTGELVSIPVSDKLKELFKRIDYKPLYYTNQAYNRLLKSVGTLAEIHTPLTAHLSRHTAAVRWANGGISQEVTGKLLGHSDLKTTAIYYRITGARIDEELKKLK